MYIKDVTIEGFKSYARRVHVSAFDPLFNAITGLNGSGKSNILDAICFVLGISNLSQVRAENIADLIYKRGLAGITEAIVCITFDNRDKSRSPSGYEDKDSITVTRQIVVGGRNKYKINGRQVTPTQVQEFFRGIQLNVNNPHFLIMQGRITEVLNMKPPEILAMLEEVAGTRMYEEKRFRAFQTFDKKTQKIKEFEEVMTTELQPTLHRLRDDRNKLMQYTKAKQNLASLERFCLAYELTATEQKVQRDQNMLVEIDIRKQQLEEEATDAEKAMQNACKTMEKMQKKIEREHGQGILCLQETVEGYAKQLSQNQTEKKLKVEERDTTLQEIQKIGEELMRLGEDMVMTTKQEAKERLDLAKANEQEIMGEISEMKRELGQMHSSQNAPSKSFLMEKLEDLKIQQMNTSSKLKENELKCNMLESKMKVHLKEPINGTIAAAEEELKIAESALCHVSQKMKDCNMDERKIQELQDALKQKQIVFQAAKQRSKELSKKLADLKLAYDDLVAGVDPKSVKGFVGELFRVKQKEALLALEISAGIKLKDVVVDTMQTGKRILQKKNLRRKITVLPIDQMQASEMETVVKETASKLFGSNAVPAIELLEFDSELHAIMTNVFGNTFICKDNETAKAMAFHPSIKTRCVSLDGNDYSPSGLLTSGNRGSGGSFLQSIQEAKEAALQLKLTGRQYSELKAEVELNQGQYDKFHELEKEHDARKAAVLSLEKKLDEKRQMFQKLQKDIQQQLKCEQHSIVMLQHKENRLQAKRNELEHQVQSFDGNEAEYSEFLKMKLKTSEEAHKEAERELSSAEKELQTLNANQDDISKHRSQQQEQLNALHVKISEIEKDILQEDNRIQESERNLKEATGNLTANKEKLSYIHAQTKELQENKQNLETKFKSIKQEKHNLNSRTGRVKLETAQDNHHIQKMLEKHEWLVHERMNFGVEGSEFDWVNHDPHQRMSEYRHAKTTISSLKQHIDPNVVQQYENVENDYKQLKMKHRRVIKDRKNIEQAILDLDDKKSDSVKTIWERVNNKFGSIFGSLLRGSDAKLEPPEGATYLEGLEVKVALGGIWKQSLLELSGGQRSLLALSLILAILLFKPAPFYILDEVDSALDLSHTQNIGQMIKRFFPQSQFIVVSLKEGMFNNANVIFKTKFSEGVSTVIRTHPEKEM